MHWNEKIQKNIITDINTILISYLQEESLYFKSLSDEYINSQHILRNKLNNNYQIKLFDDLCRYSSILINIESACAAINRIKNTNNKSNDFMTASGLNLISLNPIHIKYSKKYNNTVNLFEENINEENNILYNKFQTQREKYRSSLIHHAFADITLIIEQIKNLF